jgi:hypothetical protein
MSWEVEFTDEFASWWTDLNEDEQDCIDQGVGLLEARGPSLPFPYSSDINGSKHGNMRELRIQHRGEPYRVFYAFDPRRSAILLMGGNKTGDNQFYERMVPQADRIYDEHLRELEQAKAPTKPTKRR